jgi:hypothetical protein
VKGSVPGESIDSAAIVAAPPRHSAERLGLSSGKQMGDAGKPEASALCCGKPLSSDLARVVSASSYFFRMPQACPEIRL